jgi:hypothetical protein
MSTSTEAGSGCNAATSHPSLGLVDVGVPDPAAQRVDTIGLRPSIWERCLVCLQLGLRWLRQRGLQDRPQFDEGAALHRQCLSQMVRALHASCFELDRFVNQAEQEVIG